MRYPKNYLGFTAKPSEEVRAAIKAYGFRWDGSRWYADQSITSAAVCDFFGGSADGSGVNLAGLPQYVGDREMEAGCGII